MIPFEALIEGDKLFVYTKCAFYLSIIDEDGPDDLVFDVLLFDDDLADVSPSVLESASR